jgi:hypothetical protein
MDIYPDAKSTSVTLLIGAGGMNSMLPDAFNARGWIARV